MIFFQRIIHSGIFADTSSDEKRFIKLTNIFNLILIFAVSIPVILLIVLFRESGMQSYIRFLLLIAFCSLNIFLASRKHYLSAKIGTVFFPFILVFIMPILLRFVNAGMFLWFPFAIMILGALSFFIFSYEKERNVFIGTLIFYFLATIFYDWFFFHAVPHQLDLSFIYGENNFFFQVSKIVLVSFLYSSLFLAKVTSHQNMLELATLNRKLDRTNSELTYLNQHLEEIVKQRTEKLILQNARIKELAYTNSHEIRACVARIIGLINVTNEGVNIEEKSTYYSLIKETSLQLEKVTQRISNELVEEKLNADVQN